MLSNGVPGSIRLRVILKVLFLAMRRIGLELTDLGKAKARQKEGKSESQCQKHEPKGQCRGTAH